MNERGNPVNVNVSCKTKKVAKKPRKRGPRGISYSPLHNCRGGGAFKNPNLTIKLPINGIQPPPLPTISHWREITMQTIPLKTK